MSESRIIHILHGDGGGGLHHISGLINNPNLKVLDIIPPSGNGEIYKLY